jgi:hypothetical protein
VPCFAEVGGLIVADMLQPTEVLQVNFPLVEDRYEVLVALRDAYRFVEEFAPGVASVTLKQHGFTMNVGVVNVLVADAGRLLVLLAGEDGDARLSSMPTRPADYRSLRSPNVFFDGTVAEYRSHMSAIAPLHRELLLRAASKADGSPRTGTPHRHANCAELLSLAFVVDEAMYSDTSNGNIIDAPIEVALYREGQSLEAYVTVKGRVRSVRSHCFAAYNPLTCQACGLSPAAQFGIEASRLLEVHHLDPIANGGRVTDPAKDCIPLCPTCHRLAHLKGTVNEPLDLAELKRLVRSKTN